MKLRDYQARTVDDVDAMMADGMRRVVVVAPTGSGKGTVAAHLIKRAHNAGLRVTFIVHRVEIVRDIANRLRSCRQRLRACLECSTPVTVEPSSGPRAIKGSEYALNTRQQRDRGRHVHV